MIVEEVFCDLFDKYGEEFNWYLIPLSKAKETLVEELKRELGKEHILYHKNIFAVAKCESNDDVLYVTNNESGEDIYYIFHLTYSSDNVVGFPRYEEFKDIYAVKNHIENLFIDNCMENNGE
ncbi:MAG: hypothetical protein SO415_07635 [Oliverpabstia sp.]|nr:hypothetical protein [Oliverpabstia sp.]